MNRVEFINEQRNKAVRRKPVKTHVSIRGTLFNLRNKGTSIREAALRRKQIILVYFKRSEDRVKEYICSPYEWKWKKMKDGYRKVFYAYDMDDQTIKSFLFRNIKRVAITDRSFVPMWPVRIF